MGGTGRSLQVPSPIRAPNTEISSNVFYPGVKCHIWRENAVVLAGERSRIGSLFCVHGHRTNARFPVDTRAQVSVYPIGHVKRRASLSDKNKTSSYPGVRTRVSVGRLCLLTFSKAHRESASCTAENYSLIHVSCSRLTPHWSLNLQISKPAGMHMESPVY